MKAHARSIRSLPALPCKSRPTSHDYQALVSAANSLWEESRFSVPVCQIWPPTTTTAKGCQEDGTRLVNFVLKMAAIQRAKEGDMKSLLRDLGVVVGIPPEDIRASGSFWFPGNPVILVQESGEAEYSCVLAHQLGHLIFPSNRFSRCQALDFSTTLLCVLERSKDRTLTPGLGG